MDSHNALDLAILSGQRQDALGEFLAARCIRSVSSKVLYADLFAAYTAWCCRAGELPLGKRIFGRRLLERGGITNERGTANRVYLHGIGLNGGERNMMDAHEIMDLAKARGIRLTAAGDKLRYNGPDGGMTAELLALMAEHKAGILAILSGHRQGELPMMTEPAAEPEAGPSLDDLRALESRIRETLQARGLPAEVAPGQRVTDAELYARSEAKSALSSSELIRTAARERLGALGIDGPKEGQSW